jgi:phosphoserine phosphatase
MGIITGGFDVPAKMVAQHLHINPELVFANKVIFDYNGEFYDFNPDQPLAKENGKLEVIKQIKSTHKPKKIYFVGDSYSDMKVTPEVTKFIGFGGVIEREKVRKEAKYYVYDPLEILDLID